MPALDCDLFGLLHQRTGDTRAAKGRIDRKPMNHDGRLVDVPTHLRVVRLLVHCDGCHPGDGLCSASATHSCPRSMSR